MSLPRWPGLHFIQSLLVSVSPDVRLTVRYIIKRKVLGNIEFIIASLTYIIAHVVDYLFTVPGVMSSASGEGNPVIQGYIDYFGIQGGLLFSKSLICGSVILGVKAISIAYKRKKTKIKAEHILYSGAVLTTLGGSLWLC